jgi:hypothetical protein
VLNAKVSLKKTRTTAAMQKPSHKALPGGEVDKAFYLVADLLKTNVLHPHYAQSDSSSVCLE